MTNPVETKVLDQLPGHTLSVQQCIFEEFPLVGKLFKRATKMRKNFVTTHCVHIGKNQVSYIWQSQAWPTEKYHISNSFHLFKNCLFLLFLKDLCSYSKNARQYNIIPMF